MEVNLYAIPFKDSINMDFAEATLHIEFWFSNALREEVKHNKIVQNRVGSEIQIQVSDLPKGMNMLKVNLDHYLRSFVLIKN